MEYPDALQYFKKQQQQHLDFPKIPKEEKSFYLPVFGGRVLEMKRHHGTVLWLISCLIHMGVYLFGFCFVPDFPTELH